MKGWLCGLYLVLAFIAAEEFKAEHRPFSQADTCL
jgi:hypothetical protein